MDARRIPLADTGMGYNFESSIYKFSVVNPASFDSLAFWVKADDIIPEKHRSLCPHFGDLVATSNEQIDRLVRQYGDVVLRQLGFFA